jgi:hypothetical protein
MASRRMAIRNAMQAALKGTTLAGQNVFSNLSSTSWREQFPCIVIYTQSESIEQSNTAPPEFIKTLQIAVQVLAEGSEDPNSGVYAEDIVDTIADQVETELNRDSRLGDFTTPTGKVEALLDSLTLTGMDFQFEGEGAKPVASARLEYEAVYHEFRPGSLEEQPGVGDFKTINAKWKVGHNNSAPDNVVEAEDTVTIPD